MLSFSRKSKFDYGVVSERGFSTGNQTVEADLVARKSGTQLRFRVTQTAAMGFRIYSIYIPQEKLFDFAAMTSHAASMARFSNPAPEEQYVSSRQDIKLGLGSVEGLLRKNNFLTNYGNLYSQWFGLVKKILDLRLYGVNGYGELVLTYTYVPLLGFQKFWVCIPEDRFVFLNQVAAHAAAQTNG